MERNNNQPIKQSFFNNIANDFDVHVRQSIPLFGEFIDNVRKNLTSREFRKSRILDICGSTGKFGYDLLNTGKFQGSYINLDGSPEMIKISRELGKEHEGQHITILGGFMSSWTDESGINIPLYDTKGKYFDVSLEILGFQFFTKEREAGIIEIKKSMVPRGVAIFCEKFSNENKELWNAQEELKDIHHKSRFFTPEQIEAKKKNVLQDMGEYCYDYDAFKALLNKHFLYVKEVYKAGNFAGFVCSNSMFKWKANTELTDNIFNA